MTHTLTTGTPYKAVMGISEEEISHLQSIAKTYMVQWGKGLPVCIILVGTRERERERIS
jgi:hypothetical protein